MTPRIELLKAVVAAGLTEPQALDLLQLEHGTVSDLCTSLAQVADADCVRAIAVINRQPRKKL